MTTLDERLRAQNNGQPWIDCNDHGRAHHWRWEQTTALGRWYVCARCPVSTVTDRLDSDGHAVIPAPFLR